MFLDLKVSKNIIGVVLPILATALLLSFVSLLAKAQEPADSLKIEYAFSEKKFENPQLLPETLLWQPFNPRENRLAPSKGESLWLRFNHLSTSSESYTLRFEKVFMRFKFFNGAGKVIHSFGGDSGYAGFPPHLLTMNPAQDGKTYFMRIDSEHQRIGPIGTIELGQRSQFIMHMLKDDLVPFFVSSILALLSVSGLLLFAFYSNVRTYLHLALFSACVFFYLIAGLRLRHELGLDPALLGNLSLLGLFCSPIFFIQFYTNIFSIDGNTWVKNTVLTNTVFVAVALAALPFSDLGLLPFLTYFYALAVPIFSAVFIHSIFKLRRHPYAKTFYLGFAFLFLGGLWEMGNEIRLFNSNFRMLHVGVLLFFVCMTAMQGQFFSELFRTSQRNERAEIAARNRLQRVFDCTSALAQAHSYRDALTAVAIAISNQLSLSGYKFTIDFMINKNAFSKDVDAGSEFLHFTFVNSDEKNAGKIYEVVRPEQGRARSSLLPAFASEPLTAIPSIEEAQGVGSETSSMSPESVLTLPLESNSLDGAIILRRFDSQSFVRDDRNQLFGFINAVATSLLIALKNIEYLKEVRRKAQIEAQLDAAESLQNALLPPSLNLKDVKLSSYARSAGKTGGDWFGYYYSEKKQRFFVTIGDVTGHDFAASILTGVAAGIIKSWESYNSDSYASASEAVEQLAQHVNRVMLDSSQGLKFMSMLFVCIELENGLCHVVNAGHPHPMHIIPEQRPESIVVSGSLLGVNADTTYSSETIQLTAKDSIVLYTDGLLENTGPNGESISRRSILQFCKKTEFNAQNLDLFVDFTRDIWDSHPPDDDVSIVVLTWKPEEEAAMGAA
ncbi:MAG: hypothetical protein RL189_708 [Pseudomonadota bacterium]|jgi:serine phosphatase RsbU (regulator of sigma subunit)